MAQDILLTETNDILVLNNDLVIGTSDAQHVGLLLKTSPGQIKFKPSSGINIYKELNDNKPLNVVISSIKIGVKNDGATDADAQIIENQINVYGTYN
jgi:hypothetical protein